MLFVNDFRWNTEHNIKTKTYLVFTMCKRWLFSKLIGWILWSKILNRSKRNLGQFVKDIIFCLLKKCNSVWCKPYFSSGTCYASVFKLYYFQIRKISHVSCEKKLFTAYQLCNKHYIFTILSNWRRVLIKFILFLAF